MSVEATSGETTESLPLFDGEIRIKDWVSEAITSLATQVIHFNSFQRQSVELTFAPFHSGEYAQTHLMIQELARRVARLAICFPTWMATLPFATVAALATTVGNLAHSSLYRTKCGDFKGETSLHPKTCLLNPRMLTGIAPQKAAGVELGSERYDRLVDTIRDNNPDVLFLPEVNRFTAPSLIKDLYDRYHFFFSGMGEKMVGEDASFFIAFRGELIRPPEYIPFREQGWLMERGYFIMETKERTYVCTYNPTPKNWSEILTKEYGDKEVVLMGEMSSEDCYLLTDAGFVSMIPGGYPTITAAPFIHYHGTEEGKPTSVPFLFMNQLKGKTEVVPMHDSEKIAEALSDHAMILHR
ncbi:MAG: hypothetical protein KDK64_07435 [Chlamydiia bacterium]|nr:hypothetical protein [Chlamydiia bacterium]